MKMESEIKRDWPDKWVEKARAQYPAGEPSRRLTAIAADPNTPGSVLETVAREALLNFDARHNGAVDACFSALEAAAAHPNTPPVILTELIKRSPILCRAVCRNPVTPFLLLEQPSFLADLPEVLQFALLREADIPESFAQMLAAEKGAAQTTAVRNAARLHIQSPGSAKVARNWKNELRDYWKNECAETRNPIARHWHADLVDVGLAPSWANGRSGLPESVHPIRFASFPVIDEWLRFKHAEGSPQRAAMMKRLAPKAENRETLAWNLREDATPADLRAALNAPGGEPNWIRETVLRHPSVTAALIAQIIKSGNVEARVVAGLPQTPPRMLIELLQNPDPFLRRLARKHPNAPPSARKLGRRVALECASRLTEAPSPFVSFVVALYASQPSGDRVAKAEHALWTQRLEAVFLTPNSGDFLSDDRIGHTGRALLQHLSHDGNVFVHAAAHAKLADPDYKFTL